MKIRIDAGGSRAVMLPRSSAPAAGAGLPRLRSDPVRKTVPVEETSAELRRRIAGDYLDLTKGQGLEIGPLAAPIALRGSVAVRYVDVMDRDGLLAHYAHEPTVDPDDVPEIDFWLAHEDGSVATLGEAVASGAPFDWVIASHVVEHVPDVVGWLREIGDILADDGSAFLVVPDRRFCFDVRRSPTTVGMALQSHELGDRIPSIRAVYDHLRTAVDMPTELAWQGEVAGPERTLHSLSDVLDGIARVRDGEYVDAHVWTFTPGSFIDLIEDLDRLGLIDLTIREIVPTAQGQLEFYVVLDRIPRGSAPAAAQATRQRGTESARARVPSEQFSQAHHLLILENQRTQDELARLQEELVGVQRKLARLQGALTTKRERLRKARAQRDRLRRRLRRAQRMLEAPPPRSGGPWRLPRRLWRRLRQRVRPAPSHDQLR